MRVIRVAWVVLLALLVVSGVAQAISNPSSVSIGDVYVFRNVLVTGDQLFFVRYNVSYASVPTEPVGDTFSVVILDTDGTTVLGSRNLNYYQINIISIYRTPAQALTWQGAYTVKITGSPALFDPLVEGTNMASRTLGAGDYYEGGSLTGVMRSQAAQLQTAWSITILTATAEGVDVLNSTGASYFSKAVPGLASMIPDFYSTGSGTSVKPKMNLTITVTDKKGPSLSDAAHDLGQLMGVSDAWASWWLLGFMYLFAASVLFSATQKPGLSIAMATPVFLIGAWMMGPAVLAVVMTIFIVISILFALKFFGVF